MTLVIPLVRHARTSPILSHAEVPHIKFSIDSIEVYTCIYLVDIQVCT